MKSKRSTLTCVAVCLVMSVMCISCKKTSENESYAGVLSDAAYVTDPFPIDDQTDPVSVADKEPTENQNEKQEFSASANGETSDPDESRADASEESSSEEEQQKITKVNEVSSADGNVSKEEDQDPNANEPKEEDSYTPIEMEDGEIIIDLNSHSSSGSSKSGSGSSDKNSNSSDPKHDSADGRTKSGNQSESSGQGEETVSSGAVASGSDNGTLEISEDPAENQESATTIQKMYRGDLAGEEDTSI